MSCLYPPCYFPTFIYISFIFSLYPMFVCTKCWCLSYVFSAFGLFSYCLPGLFGSSPPQPVWFFLASIGCWSGHVFVCQFGSFFITVPSLSTCQSALLCLICLSLHPCGVSCIFSDAFSHCNPVTMFLFLSGFTLHPLLFVCVPLNFDLWLPLC